MKVYIRQLLYSACLMGTSLFAGEGLEAKKLSYLNLPDIKSPDWIKRFDFSYSGFENNKPIWAIRTIQPLYEVGETHTFFTQLRASSFTNSFNKGDNTFNIGLGYRYLLPSEKYLIGANIFYDIERRYEHHRAGIGLEAIGEYLTFRGNGYLPVSGLKTVELTGGIEYKQRVMAGYDLEVETPVPGFPWMRFAASTYRWLSATDGIKDVVGDRLRLRAQIHPRITIEGGRKDDNFRRPEAYIQVSVNLDRSREGLAKSLFDGWFSKDAKDAKRIPKQHRLDYVIRENEIKVEQTSFGGGGIVIGRGT